MHTLPQFVTTHNQQFTSLFTIHFTQHYSLSRLTINSSHHSLLSIAHRNIVCHDSQSTVHITLYYPLHTYRTIVCHDSQSTVQFTSLFTIHCTQLVTTHNQQFTSLFTIHFTQYHSLSRLTINSSHHSLLSISHSTTVFHDSQSTVQFTSIFTIHCTQNHSLSRLTVNSSHHSLLSIAHSTTVCHDSQSAVHITLYYPLHTAPQFVTIQNQQFTSLFTIHCIQLVTIHNQQFTSLFTIYCTQYHSGFCGYVNGSHHSFGENKNNKIHRTASTHIICHHTPRSLWSLLQETTENCPRLPRNC